MTCNFDNYCGLALFASHTRCREGWLVTPGGGLRDAAGPPCPSCQPAGYLTWMADQAAKSTDPLSAHDDRKQLLGYARALVETVTRRAAPICGAYAQASAAVLAGDAASLLVAARLGAEALVPLERLREVQRGGDNVTTLRRKLSDTAACLFQLGLPGTEGGTLILNCINQALRHLDDAERIAA